MSLTPSVLWAQTKDAVYVTVELSGAQDVNVNITNESMRVSAVKDGKDYNVEFNFFKPIYSDQVKTASSRLLKYRIPKIEHESWSALNSCGKKHYIKCDWNMWVDSDAEDDDMLNSNFDMSNFGGDFGADFGNDGYDDDLAQFDDSDEEENPCGGKSKDCCDGHPSSEGSGSCSNPKCKCEDGTCKADSADNCCGPNSCKCSSNGLCCNPTCNCTSCNCSEKGVCCATESKGECCSNMCNCIECDCKIKEKCCGAECTCDPCKCTEKNCCIKSVPVSC